jgi:endonuclease YncB( thermonuclease family)
VVEKIKSYNILLLTLIGAAVAAAPLPAGAEMLRGTATVIDGQTLEIEGRRLALVGVLAPPLAMSCTTKREKSYPCGELARQALADLVGGNQIVCSVAAATQVGAPTEAVCQIGPFSLSEMIIASGRVLARPGVSERYDKAARSARLLGEGLWKGGFPPPETWRPSRRPVAP